MIEKVHFILLLDGKNIGCEKCAFVVPVYEVSESASHLLANKTELIRFVHSNLSQEFHKVTDQS